MLKGIYLGAYTAYHPGYDIVYQDINGKRDIPGDMMEIDLSPYDYIIATPPCNWWSKMNTKPSQYALDTKHLLPDIISRLRSNQAPFIVENVRNKPKFQAEHLFDYPDIYVYFIGRHTIWTNVPFNTFIPHEHDWSDGDWIVKKKDRQGSNNVHLIIEAWLKEVHKNG